MHISMALLPAHVWLLLMAEGEGSGELCVSEIRAIDNVQHLTDHQRMLPGWGGNTS